MRQVKKHPVGEMLGKEDRALSTTGGTQAKALARDWPECSLLDALKTVPAVGGGVLVIVVLAEVGEVSLEYGMEVIATTGNVPLPSRDRDRECRAHITIYGCNELPASDRAHVHRSSHNTYEASPRQKSKRNRPHIWLRGLGNGT